MKYHISRKRKNEIKDCVLDIMAKSDIHSLPIDIASICKAYNITLIEAQRLAPRSSREALRDDFDGFSIKSGDRYMIIYNAASPKVRIRYTVACQIAHIFLFHLKNGICSDESDAEAAYFADELLMPLSVLDSFSCKTPEAIAAKCGVSNAAAQIRARDFERRESYKKENGETEYDMKFLHQFFG